MLDISYSMKWASNPTCKHGLCGSTSSPITDFDSGKNYHGIFDSSKNYAYDTSIPVDSAPYSGREDAPYHVTVNTSKKGAFVESDCTPSTSGNCWDGNFLNWLTSKRIDTVRAVLVGGKAESRSGFDYLGDGTTTWKLVGHNEPGDTDIYKKENNSSKFSPYVGNTVFLISSPASSGGTDMSPYDPYAKLIANPTSPAADSTFNIAVVVKEEPRGLVHDIQDKVRLGLSTYRYKTTVSPSFPSFLNGGTLHLAIPRNPFVKDPRPQGFRYIDTPIKADASDIIDAIEHHPLAQGSTPLAENLYEVGNYFKQEPPHYNDDSTESNFLINDEWDPYVYKVDGKSQMVRCAKSSVILFTDGVPWYDSYVPSDIIGDYDKDGNSADCFNSYDYYSGCNNNLDDVAKYLRWKYKDLDDNGNPIYEDRDLRSDLDDEQYLDIYTVGFGSSEPAQILKDAAENGNGIAYAAEDGDALKKSIMSAINTILKRTSSGSSISVLSEKATSGALINQALFFPDKSFTDEDGNSHNVSWTGSLNAYWFYNTKTFSNIRENTIDDQYDDYLNIYPFGLDIYKDLILDFVINDKGLLAIDKYNPLITGANPGAKDPNSKPGGAAGPAESTTDIGEVKTIFDPGELLRERQVNTAPDPGVEDKRRLIYGVTKHGTQAEFIQANTMYFKDLFNLSASDLPSCLGTGADAADNLISYIRGTSDSFIDPADGITEKCRSRQVNGPKTAGAAASDQLWKLGDIIYSTPKVQEYDNYGMLFTGANDGMLHAFKIGKIRKDQAKTDQAVALCDTDNGHCSNDEIGDEAWSFIPQNALPYLKYLADPDYKHIYTVDLSPYIIESGDRVILIGGMRFGGGVGCNDGSDWCGDTTSSLAVDSNISPYQAPSPSATVASLTSAAGSSTEHFITNPYNPNTAYTGYGSVPEFSPTTIGTENVGMSSYFALDVTDPDVPKFLWEFTDPQLGYSYSGPAFIKRVVRGAVRNYVMFLSGPINANGRSADGQELAAFILELDEDFTYKTLYKIDSGLAGDNPFGNVNIGFGGRLFTDGVDYNEDGNTDAVFFGGNWLDGDDWKGDVFLIAPTDDPPTTSGSSPTLNWVVKNVLNEGHVPITNRIEHGICYGSHYIYFGSGRWFYKTDTPGTTGGSDTNALYGIQIDECMQDLVVAGGDCSGSFNTPHSAMSGDTLCDSTNQLISGQITWSYNNLAANDGNGYFMERSITDPTFAANNIYFTTMQPSSNLCDFGGRTRVWGLNCRTGHSITGGCSNYRSEPPPSAFLLQLSGGNIENNRLQDTTFSEENNMATQWFKGVSPESATPVMQYSGKLDGEILLWIER